MRASWDYVDVCCAFALGLALCSVACGVGGEWEKQGGKHGRYDKFQ